MNPEDNIQFKNVGNLGDILKHAPLIEFLRLLKKDEPVIYIDFHTFLIEAPFPNKKSWEETVTKLGDSYKNYKKFQSENSKYLCSSGTSIKILSSEKNLFIFSEQDEKTRENLKSQISIKNYFLMNNSRNLTKLVKENEKIKEIEFNGMIGLIDPFKITTEEWNAIIDGLNVNFSTIERGIILCFNYTKEEKMDWKQLKAPNNYELRGFVNQFPYTLSCYSTSKVKEEISEILKLFHWEII
eukprot:gene9-4260_t